MLGRKIIAVLLCTGCLMGFLASGARADETPKEPEKSPEKWQGPFGGTFNANVTVTSDYSYAGISNNALQPAYQLGLDYRTPDLAPQSMRAVPIWLYLTGWGSNVTLPNGPGVEVDIAGGVKVKLTSKWRIDLGYIRVAYPGQPAELGYDYGDFGLSTDYDFGVATLSGRLRASPNSFGNSGHTFNKRGMVSVPLPFVHLSDAVSFKAYGSLGNLWVEHYLAYGIPSSDYWYWQLGLVTSAFGFEMTVAYTDTSISPEGCSYSGFCAGRVFVSLTKSF
jgi:uncharacterized protein (TIGR02001 family)